MSHKPNTLKLETTVVGSYPADVSANKILNQFYFSSSDSFHDAIKSAVDDEERAGIDLISDGQVRGDIVSLVASRCHGITMNGRRPQIVSEIKRKGSIIAKDMAFVKSLAAKDVKIKGVVTGPYTLARNCENKYYKNDEEASWAFVDVLKEEFRKINGRVDMIQLDEPFLSVEYLPKAKDMIHELAKNLDVPLSLHVCGDVKNIFMDLLEYKVDIIDLEFVAYPKNIDLLKEYKFDKKLGFGCVSVEDRTIEPVGVIKERIKKALDALPARQLIIDPDCGMRNLTREIAFAKLKNMVAARDEILQDN